jgi:hypothetical protein
VKADELFREVDEELQREKMQALWKRYGGYVVALALVVVLATVAWIGWQEWQARQLHSDARAYEAAGALAAAGDAEAAAGAFGDVAGDAGQGFTVLSRLRQAQLLLDAGDREGALAALGALAGDGSVEPMMSDLARLQAAAIEIDTADPAELIARLEPLAEPGDAWRLPAQELLAIALLRSGDQARARELLDGILADAEASADLRRRAGELKDALSTAAGS